MKFSRRSFGKGAFGAGLAALGIGNSAKAQSPMVPSLGPYIPYSGPIVITAPDQLVGITSSADNPSGLYAWFDAQQPMYKDTSYDLVASAGDNVAIWPDATGRGYNLTNPSTAPTYSPTGINGLPAVNMGGSGYLSYTSFFDGTFANGATMFVVNQTGTISTNSVMAGASSLYFAKNTSNIWSGSDNIGGFGNGTYFDDPSIDAYIWNGATRTYVSGQIFEATGGNPGNASQSSMLVPASGSLTLSGQTFQIGALGGGYKWPGLVGAALIFNRALTLEQFRQVYDYLAGLWKIHTGSFVVCVGNSLTSGTGSTSGPTQALSKSGDNYPNQLWALLPSTVELRTDAYPGRSTTQLIEETPSFSQLFTLPSTGRKQVAIIWEVTNQMVQANSVDSAYRLLVDLCVTYRNRGFKVVVVTCLPRNDTVYAGFAADFLTVNTAIRNNWQTFADALADVYNWNSGILQNTANATYWNQSAKPHLTSLGYGQVANCVYAAMAGLY